MSTTNKSIVFLALAFAISWAIVIGAHFAGLSQNPQFATVILAAMMTGPAISALICTFAFEKKGERIKALGLNFKPNVWWFLAWLIPIMIGVGSVVATLMLSSHHYTDIGEAVRTQAELQGQDMSVAPAFMTNTIFIVTVAAIFGGLVNMPILTFTEELGWRGYLYSLWRPSGFWRTSIGTGVVWGIWHAPAIFFFGLNYPDDRALGLGLFVLFCVLLTPVITLVRERSGSVWAAGLFHGTFNALGGLTLLAISTPVFPWNGIVGIGGFVALAVFALITLLIHRPRAPALQAATA